MSKQLILEYLQTHALELIEKYPEVVEASFAAKPSRILIVATKDFEPPTILYKGKNLKVEVAVNEYYQKPEITGEDPNVKEWRERNKIKPQGVVDKVIDVSVSPDKAKSRDAFEAWRQRHSQVKKIEE